MSTRGFAFVMDTTASETLQSSAEVEELLRQRRAAKVLSQSKTRLAKVSGLAASPTPQATVSETQQQIPSPPSNVPAEPIHSQPVVESRTTAADVKQKSPEPSNDTRIQTEQEHNSVARSSVPPKIKNLSVPAGRKPSVRPLIKSKTLALSLLGVLTALLVLFDFVDAQTYIVVTFIGLRLAYSAVHYAFSSRTTTTTSQDDGSRSLLLLSTVLESAIALLTGLRNLIQDAGMFMFHFLLTLAVSQAIRQLACMQC